LESWAGIPYQVKKQEEPEANTIPKDKMLRLSMVKKTIYSYLFISARFCGISALSQIPKGIYPTRKRIKAIGAICLKGKAYCTGL